MSLGDALRLRESFSSMLSLSGLLPNYHLFFSRQKCHPSQTEPCKGDLCSPLDPRVLSSFQCIPGAQGLQSFQKAQWNKAKYKVYLTIELKTNSHSYQWLNSLLQFLFLPCQVPTPPGPSLELHCAPRAGISRLKACSGRKKN